MSAYDHPFLSLDDQIRKLKSKGLIIEDEDNVKQTLAREGYDNIFAENKKAFLQRNGRRILTRRILWNDVWIDDDFYRNNVTFNDVYLFSKMFHEISGVLMDYILMMEASFKAQCSYHYCNRYPEMTSYLNWNNYNNEDALHFKVFNLHTKLDDLVNYYSQHDSRFSHYQQTCGGVPLWIVMKKMTFGTMSYFYECSSNDVKDKIANFFSNEYLMNYTVNNGAIITPTQLFGAIRLIYEFRNRCAHYDVLYHYQAPSDVAFLNHCSHLFIAEGVSENVIKEKNLFSLICIMRFFLTKDDYFSFIDKLKSIIDEYEIYYRTNHRRIFEFEKRKMGFISNWDNLLKS